MNYRCPHCKQMMRVHKLFFSDISACKECGQKVVLGDAVCFFIASMSMMIMALASLYQQSQKFPDPYVSGGYALAIGMVTGIVVMLLLGRAMPYKRIRRNPQVPPQAPAQS
jgi:hypothetical protein